jgi:hypothetical protein
LANWTEETVKVGGTELVLVRGGSGRPLLMLHDELGYPGWVSWNDALAAEREFIPASIGSAATATSAVSMPASCAR